MLGDPKKLRTRGGHGFLVSWRDRLATDGAEQASELAEQLLTDPANVDAIRGGLGRPDASPEELKDWLVSGLASGTFALLRTASNPRRLRAPQSQDLQDLIEQGTGPRGQPAPGPLEEHTFIGVEVVDEQGQRPGGGELRLSLNGRFSAHDASVPIQKRRLPPGSRAGAGYLHLDFHKAPAPDNAVSPPPLGPDSLPPDVVTFEVVSADGVPLPASYRLRHDDAEVAAGRGAEGHVRVPVNGTPLALELELDR